MSLRSEIIAALDAVSGLSSRNYADKAPEGSSFPYTTMQKDLGVSPQMIGDGLTSWWRWLGQVDLWQERANEDDALVTSIRNALDGTAVEAGLRIRVRSVNRVPDPNFDIVHHAFTLATPVPR